MTDQRKLALILLPLLALGIIQMIYAIKQRKKLPVKFAALFFASGVVTLLFSAALWIIGIRMLNG
ncbi:MAG: hypothetical protein LBK46_04435 [Oscillospiraceae bacterium]|jgi:hypothetical protein|nr:hypothetical protein [Oscillospiraceae bacterium]